MPFPGRWGLTDAKLIAETFSSRIFKVRLPDGTPAVVNHLKPFDDVEDELRGAHLLAWRCGEGLVRLLEIEGSSMLLEYAGDTMLSHALEQDGDRAATEIAAGVMARLHSPSSRPAPPDLQPLRQRFADLFRKAEGQAGRRSPYVQAAAVAERLLSDQRDVKPLHGDLHHENIMHGPRGWLAIDPKGVLGDPAFDAERIAGMAEVFARTLGQSPRRILDHVVAYGCLSAAWHAGDGNDKDENRELAVAAAVGKVRDLSF
ncbi:aminoglycoside phosphotransferase family protein [Mesorhizobium sp. SP-1A]|uniref:aminoglycoside phosphotransferase family protein n=1 Tax=Mesorhizobium sp. SP-1A TaxID=3077840 RepID=UPI0039656421